MLHSFGVPSEFNLLYSFVPGQMHSERKFVYQSIKKASTSNISFDELCLSFPHVMHWPRLISLPFLDVAVVIFSVSVTRRHFKQYIFNIRKIKKNDKYKKWK